MFSKNYIGGMIQGLETHHQDFIGTFKEVTLLFRLLIHHKTVVDPGFPRSRDANLKFGLFPPKLHENEINQIGRMRVHPLRPRIRQCKMFGRYRFESFDY